MPATSPQLLLEEAACYLCFGPLSEVQMLRLSLLARLLRVYVPMAATDPQTLLAYGKCFPCYGGASLGDMMELSLLDQISQNASSGSSGSSCLYCGDVPPAIVPTCDCALYYDRTAGGFYFWDANLAQWITLIAS